MWNIYLIIKIKLNIKINAMHPIIHQPFMYYILELLTNSVIDGNIEIENKTKNSFVSSILLKSLVF